MARSTDTHPTSRGWRAVLLAIVALLAPFVGPLDDAGAQPTADAEHHFLDLLNSERQGRGLGPLAVNAALRADARAWSATMAQSGRIFHTSTLGQDTARSVPGWRRAAENVGVGPSVPVLHDAFMASPGHRANILGDHNQVGIGVVESGQRIYVTVRFAQGPIPAAFMGHGAPDGDLWLVNAAGRVLGYGRAGHHGDASSIPLAAPIVGMAPTPSGAGYWLLGRDGGIFTYGDAPFFGSTGAMRLNRPVNGMAATPSGRGYWLVASDGGIFTFGDARFFGSTGAMRLNRPVNGMAATPSGRGYWLVASDGGIFTFGDARFYGSAADGRLGAPTASVTTSPTGRGYWIVGTNGRVAAFGDARHLGDAASLPLPSPIVRIQTTPDGAGYWLVGADGAVYPFGNAGSRISAPVSTGSTIVAVARR